MNDYNTSPDNSIPPRGSIIERHWMRERFAREAAQDAFRRGYVHPADRNFRDRAPSFTQQKKSDTSESITARLMAAGLRGAV